jgi:hypothetical protein
MQLTRHSPPASAGVRRPGEISPRGRENSAFQVIPVLNRVITFFHLSAIRRGRHEILFTFQWRPEAGVKWISSPRANSVRIAFCGNYFVQFAIRFRCVAANVALFPAILLTAAPG